MSQIRPIVHVQATYSGQLANCAWTVGQILNSLKVVQQRLIRVYEFFAKDVSGEKVTKQNTHTTTFIENRKLSKAYFTVFDNNIVSILMPEFHHELLF